MSPSTSTGAVLRALRRFSTLVIVCGIVAAAAAAALSYRSDVTYTGNAIYLVPPGSGTDSALTPYDAERIAHTYSVVLTQDQRLLASLSSAVHLSPDDVAARVAGDPLPNSSAVRITYRGDTPAQVRAFFTELTSLVQQPVPPTPNLAAGTLRLLHGVEDISQSGGGSWLATVAGLLAGLLLGGGIAVWLDRALPRVLSAADLREPGGPSALDVAPEDESSVAALAVRLLTGCPQGGWIAVTGVDRSAGAAAELLARRLASATRDLVAQGSLHEDNLLAQWLPATLGDGAERVAQDADRTLLVVPRSTDLRLVAIRLSELRDLGVTDLVLSVCRSARRRRRAREVSSLPVLDPAT